MKTSLLCATALFLIHCGASVGTGADGSTEPVGDGGTTLHGTVSCVETISSGTIQLPLCIDATGLTTDQYNALAMTCMNGAPSDGGADLMAMLHAGACTHANAIGGCEVSSGGFQETSWYYVGGVFTADLVQSSCMTAHGTFVMP